MFPESINSVESRFVRAERLVGTTIRLYYTNGKELDESITGANGKSIRNVRVGSTRRGVVGFAGGKRSLMEPHPSNGELRWIFQI